MTSLDLGPLQRSIAAARKVSFQPHIDMQEFTAGFGLGKDLAASDSMLAERLGSEKWLHGRTLMHAMKLGLRRDDFDDEDRAILDEFIAGSAQVAGDLVVASKLAQTTGASDVARVPASFTTSVAQVPTDLIYAAGSIASLPIEMLGGGEDVIPRAMNWALGLNQTATPDLLALGRARGRQTGGEIENQFAAARRAKLEEAARDTSDPARQQRAQQDLDALLRDTPTPLADEPLQATYEREVLAEQLRTASLPMAQRVGEGAVEVLGNVKALLSGGTSRVFEKVETKLKLPELAQRLTGAAAKQKTVLGRLATRYAAGFVGKGARFAVAETARTAPTGERDWEESLLNGAVTALMMPVFGGASWAAERVQRWIGGEASALSVGFKRFLGKAPLEAQARWMASGKLDTATAYREFVDAGMPFVEKSIRRQVMGLGVRAVLESLAFSPTDRAFWTDLSHAVADGDGDAAQRVFEAMLTNALVWGVMDAGGLRKHVDRETVQRLGEIYRVDPFGTPPPPATVESRAAEEVAREGDALAAMDPRERTWKALEAKMALAGIGEPVTEGVHLLAREGESPRLVRFLDGEYQTRPLYEGEWAAAPELAAERLGPVPPQIAEQAALTGRIASRLGMDPTVPLDDAQQRIVAKATEVASRVRAEDSAGVAAALRLIDAFDPMTWGTEQFAAWTNLVLRGDTPTAAASLVNEFVTPQAYRNEAGYGTQKVEKAPARAYEPREKTGDIDTALGVEVPPEEGYVDLEGKRPAGTPRPRGEAAGVDLGEPARVVDAPYSELEGQRQAGTPRQRAAGEEVSLEPRQEPARTGYEGAVEGQRPVGTPDFRKAGEQPRAKETPDWLARRPEGVLRQIGKAMGLVEAETGSKDQLIAALRRAGVEDPEAGSANIALPAAIAGLGLLGAGILSGGIASPAALLGMATLVATPLLRRYTANQFYRTLEQHGPVEQASRIGSAVLRATQEKLQVAGRLARTANAIMLATNSSFIDIRKVGRLERLVMAASAIGGAYYGNHLLGELGGTGAGLLTGTFGGIAAAMGLTRLRHSHDKVDENRQATRSLSAMQVTDLEGQAGAAYGVTRMRIFADGWDRSLAALSRVERRIVNMVRRLGDQVAQEASDAGMVFRTRDNDLIDPANLKGLRRIPTFPTQTYYKMLDEPNGRLANAWVEAIAKLNSLDPADVRKRMDWNEPGAPTGLHSDHRTIGVELARRFRYMPDSIFLDGIEHRMLESKPFEIALAALTRSAARIGGHRIFGSELLGEELEQHPRSPEQQAMREAMAEYVKQAPSPQKAKELLTRVMRAMQGLPAFDRLTKPGSLGDAIYHGVLRPARALWVASHLSAAAILQVGETLGTPAAYTSLPTIARELATTWWYALVEPDKLRQELGRLRRRGLIGDQIPNLLAVDRQAGRLANAGERVVHAMRFFIAPMQAINTLNAVALARAGEALVADWRESPVPEANMADWMERLRQGGVDDPELARRMLAGKATDAEYDRWIGNLRRLSMGERESVEQSYTQLHPLLAETTPFQSYGSNNLRVLMDAGEALMASFDPKLPEPERKAKRKMFWRLARSKALAHGIGMAAIYYWAYGASATQAFVGEEGEFDWELLTQRYAKFVFNAEATGFAVATAARSMTEAGGGGAMSDTLIDYARTVPFIDMTLMLDEAVRSEGKFLNRAAATGVEGLAQKLLTMFEEMTPLARHVRTWAEDPELALAVRSYYEALPVTGARRNIDYSEWSSAMRRFRTKLRARLRYPQTWNSSDMWQLLEEAARAGTEGWDSVADGLRSRRLLHGLSSAEWQTLMDRVSPRLLDRLREHDAALDLFADRAARR